MLDVHILTLPSTRPDWQRQALSSLQVAARRADFPVYIHELEGGDHLGERRAAGFAAGSSPWKCYVDNDDVVLPDAFEVIGRHLAGSHAAVFTREYVMQNGYFLGKSMRRHHLQAYRADVVASFDFSQWQAMTDVALLFHAMRDPRGYLDLDDHVYIHRVYAASNGRKARKQHPHERALVAAMARTMREEGHDV